MWRWCGDGGNGGGERREEWVLREEKCRIWGERKRKERVFGGGVVGVAETVMAAFLLRGREREREDELR